MENCETKSDFFLIANKPVQEAENKLNVPNDVKQQPHDETKGHEPDVTSKRDVQIWMIQSQTEGPFCMVQKGDHVLKFPRTPREGVQKPEVGN
ncbi:hypothetical protein DEO72_LG8g175 [Vigna unguiculata]|uniref:Uncharacterized protein n=1 Tax=Vigna unguiculata TaxID=3917 RepID=A0A4D6MN13_VIGUN|nr:hypothetical protein DEO72_LG8g175 [Vigna unguiculata]